MHPRTLPVPPSTRDSLVQANLAGSGVPLPIVHSSNVHGSATDSLGDPSNSYLADSVKAVRINIRVSNGRTGAALRTRDVSTITSLPNNGLVQIKTCGTTPLLGGALTITQPGGAGTPVRLSWVASVDEAAGESDVTQYNIYRRDVLLEPSFGSVLLTVPAGRAVSVRVAGQQLHRRSPVPVGCGRSGLLAVRVRAPGRQLHAVLSVLAVPHVRPGGRCAGKGSTMNAASR